MMQSSGINNLDFFSGGGGGNGMNMSGMGNSGMGMNGMSLPSSLDTLSDKNPLQYGRGNRIINRNNTHLLSVAAPYTAKLQRIMKYTNAHNERINTLNKQVFSQNKSAEFIRTIDYDQMKMVREIVVPEMKGLITYIVQQVEVKGIHFQYANKVISPIYKELLEHNWDPLIAESFFKYIVDGFILFRFQPHPELFEIPVILDPFEYIIQFKRNEFSKNEYQIFNRLGKDVTDEVFIDTLYAPDTNGQLTSPASELIIPTIDHIIRCAAYEQSVIDQRYPTRVLVNQLPRYNNNQNNNSNDDNKGMMDPQLVLNLPHENLGRSGLGGGNKKKGITNIDGAIGSFIGSNDHILHNNGNDTFDPLMYNMMRNLGMQGKSTDNLQDELELIENIKKQALLIHPANDSHQNDLWQLAPGISVMTLPAAPEPAFFLQLCDRYQQTCSQKLNLPLDITNIKSQGHLYANETEFVTRRIHTAVYPYAKRLKHIYNFSLSQIYGTASYLQSVLDEIIKIEADIKKRQEKQELKQKALDQEQEDQHINNTYLNNHYKNLSMFNNGNDNDNDVKSKTSKKTNSAKSKASKGDDGGGTGSMAISTDEDMKSDADADDDDNDHKRNRPVTRSKKLKEAEEKRDRVIVAQTCLRNFTLDEKDNMSHTADINTHLENAQEDEDITKDSEDRNKNTKLQGKSNTTKGSGSGSGTGSDKVIKSNMSIENKNSKPSKPNPNPNNEDDDTTTTTNENGFTQEEELENILNELQDAEDAMGSSCSLHLDINWLKEIDDMSMRDKLQHNPTEVLQEFRNKAHVLTQLLIKYTNGKIDPQDQELIQTNSDVIEKFNSAYPGHAHNSYIPNEPNKYMNDIYNISVLRNNGSTFALGENNSNIYSNNNVNNNNNSKRGRSKDDDDRSSRKKKRGNNPDDDDDPDDENFKIVIDSDSDANFEYVAGKIQKGDKVSKERLTKYTKTLRNRLKAKIMAQIKNKGR